MFFKGAREIGGIEYRAAFSVAPLDLQVKDNADPYKGNYDRAEPG